MGCLPSRLRLYLYYFLLLWIRIMGAYSGVGAYLSKLFGRGLTQSFYGIIYMRYWRRCCVAPWSTIQLKFRSVKLYLKRCARSFCFTFDFVVCYKIKCKMTKHPFCVLSFCILFVLLFDLCTTQFLYLYFDTSQHKRLSNIFLHGRIFLCKILFSSYFNIFKSMQAVRLSVE